MSSIASPVFSGSSTYSVSFQQVLTRAVSIAALPYSQLQNTVATLQSQQAAMGGLQAIFSSLQNSLRNVAASSGGTLGTIISDPSALSATAASTALPGTYSIQVDNLGSQTTTLSTAGATPITDPGSQNISSATDFTLTINGVDHQVTPSGTSLQSLATAINDAGVGVEATIVNVGASGSADYRLAISSNQLGADTIQLSDGTNTSMLSTLSTGTQAVYEVAGNTISGKSRDVTLAPGINVTLMNTTGGKPVTITVSKNSAGLQSALSGFASAYNAALDAVSAQRGEKAGALEGQSLVLSLGFVLNKVSQYTSADSVGSLTALGLTSGQDGHLTFDAATFNNLNSSDISKFLGDISTRGFLKDANEALSSMADGTSGVISTGINQIKDRITAEGVLMAREQQRVQDLQAQLQQRLTAADAAIAGLESQKNYFLQMFQALYPASKAG